MVLTLFFIGSGIINQYNSVILTRMIKRILITSFLILIVLGLLLLTIFPSRFFIGFAPFLFLLFDLSIYALLTPLAIIIEALIIKKVFSLRLMKSLLITLVANSITFFAGVLIIWFLGGAYLNSRVTPIFNILVEFIFAAIWVLVILLAGTYIEAYVINKFWKTSWRQTRNALLLGNMITHVIPIVIYFLFAFRR